MFGGRPRRKNLEPDSKVHDGKQYLASRLIITLMLAMLIHAVAVAMDFSQSFASRRHRPNQPKVRSTTQRRGRTSKPFAVSERLMISRFHWPHPRSAFRNFCPT